MNKDFIEFRSGFGCYSSAGRDGGRQYIHLKPVCAEEHTLIHEVCFIFQEQNNNKASRFFMLSAYCMNINDQIEINILMST